MRVRASHLATVSVMALALPLLGASSAFAGTDNPNACFGQTRSAGVHYINDQGYNWGSTWSDSASSRAGDNARQNAEWKANGCQA